MTLRFDPDNLDGLPDRVKRQVEQASAGAQVTKGRRERPEQTAGRQLIKHVDQLIVPAPWDPSEVVCVGDYFAHNANGGARTAVEGAILRGQGVRRGWPDYTCYLGFGRYRGMVLELKAEDGGTPETEQLDILHRLERAGWYAAVAWGGDDAVRAVDKYVVQR